MLVVSEVVGDEEEDVCLIFERIFFILECIVDIDLKAEVESREN